MNSQHPTYAELLELFEASRVQDKNLQQAIDYGLAALAMGGKQDRHIKQQIGVTYRRMGRLAEAQHWFQSALNGAGTVEAANIKRDLSTVFLANGNIERAFDLIQASLQALSYIDQPVAYGASLGFRARIYRASGDTEAALEDLTVATTMLWFAGEPRVELYILLDHASLLSETGHWLASKQVARSCVTLAAKHGTQLHRTRARSLLIGGHRLEAFALRHR